MNESNTYFPKSSTLFDYIDFLPQLLDIINTYKPISTFSLPNLRSTENIDYKQTSMGNSIHLKININTQDYYSYIFHFNSFSESKF